MTFAPIVASICFKVLGWMLIAVAALLVILTLTQFFRGDAAAEPLKQIFGAAVAAGLGYASLWAADKFAALMR